MNDGMKDKLANLTGALLAVADGLKDLINETPAAEEKTESALTKGKTESAPDEKQPTLEEVRTVLAEISRSGRTAEMKALLSKFGASKLSDVKPEQYASLLQKAREVTDA